MWILNPYLYGFCLSAALACSVWWLECRPGPLSGSTFSASAAAGLLPAPKARPAGSPDMAAVNERAARKAGVDPALLWAICQQESGCRPYPPDGMAGETGPWQIRQIAAVHAGCPWERLREPQENANCAARLMALHLEQVQGWTARALCLYNAGNRRVCETAQVRGYVAGVMANYRSRK